MKGAGLAFVPYARETLLDGNADPEPRLSARRFLSEWVVQPIVEPHRSDPDFEARVRLYAQLAEVPIPEIRIMRSRSPSAPAQPAAVSVSPCTFL